MAGENGRTRSALILYGSETGNAQEIAEELGRTAERLHFVTHVKECNDVKADTLASYSLVIFAVSTTGQGDFPLNARGFWKTLLLKRLPPTFLGGVKYTQFGLGDSSYPKFNWAARKLRKRLSQLGATEIYPCGEADEQHPEGLEGTFLPWATNLRNHLLEQYPLPEALQPIPDDIQLPPKWILEEASTQPLSLGDSNQRKKDILLEESAEPHLYRLESDNRPIPDTLTVTLTQNKRVTPQGHWQDVRHICLTTPETLIYSPGDMISITPKNFSVDVDEMLTLMGWSDVADKHLSFIPGTLLQGRPRNELPAPPIPYLANTESSPITLRTLLTEYLDIRAIPRRSFFANIAHYTTDEQHKERLLEFTNPEFIDELWDYTTRPRRSILEVLHDFGTVKIPWQHAASVLPIIRGRQFSIASGGELKELLNQKTGTKFELLIAIVKYRTILKKIREGVCTRYLSVLRPGSTLKVQLQRGGLNPTLKQLVGPVVLVGPGTGLAPLRAMIWEKAAMIKASQEDQLEAPLPKIGSTILLFGGRNRAADYYFEEEWERLEKEGLWNLQVLTAFSRDQQQKVYVQDRIREHAEGIFRLLHEDGGSVFVCGSSGRMPQAVREALIECFQHRNSSVSESITYTREQAEHFLLEMEKTGRYKQETW
ncbi:NADPH-dependent FMN/FAD containing oxidoreductase, putative [Talaromyces stipitatus ATCC 10500]|uniref:NADPH-dependent diflavin oxidoreductase 1 n=1 Tax=Talaromyces stipitatus (strain ATCC 10500 / CBS 375.48 / QM 6759 / NRRL 1006) TaxID=441959 RepID=B8MR99_TALSN|nr:NADPH-dependent FMN/FAD containing oxidoreductase, putative [Talaromyces stipitatus ATCC 10500]EED12993.1 NADPH-dependent FMN/FAD containing oxidoreductase, putative [Talaromyces stipitatus ATCC 10500]